MNIEQEREAFEIYWHDLYQLGTKLARINGRYLSPAVQRAWEAWQARAAQQSQDREDALRYRYLRQAGVDYSTDIDVVDSEGCCLNEEELDAAIDHARRVEGGGE